jgi:hypothetical protein
MRASSLVRFVLPLAVVGCGNSGPVTDRYVPFDDAAVAGAHQKVAALEAFRTTLESKDFAAIQTAYTSTFQSDLKALQAAHGYVTEGAALGTTLDQQVQSYIASGLGTTDLQTKEVAEEGIQTIISRYTFETIYGQLIAGTQAGWDRAFGFYGRSSDGATSEGIAATAQDRDTEFGVRKNDAIFQAFIDGRNALAAGDGVTVSAKLQLIDKTISDVFGLSARHEFGEAAQAIAMGVPEDAVEGYSVGIGVITFLRDYMKTLPGGTTALSTIDAELAKGDPTQPATMTQVQFTSIVSAIDTTFGFHF